MAPGLEACVAGEVDGSRVHLAGLVPEHWRFSAELALTTSRTLYGLGHAPGGLVGVELTRDR
jgi:hypothetical protein